MNPIYNNYYQSYLNNFSPQVPSAPPAEKTLYDSVQIPLDAIDNLPNLEDECPICLDHFKQIPEGDAREVTWLAMTNCQQKNSKGQTPEVHHFFHDFCLEQHLSAGMNSNCPLCRTEIKDSTIVQINLGEVPAKPSSSATHTHPPLQGVAGSVYAAVKPALSATQTHPPSEQVEKSVYDTVKRVLGSFVDWMWGSNETRQKVLQEKALDIFARWETNEKTLDKDIKNNTEKLGMLLGTINSLPVTHVVHSKTAIDRITKSFKRYEEEMQKIQNEFKEFLDKELENISPDSEES